MKTPIRKTLALAAAFIGLQLFTATPAWALNYTSALVAWDRDFGTAKKVGSDNATYTIDLNGNELVGGKVRITQNKGIFISRSAARGNGTIIVRYSNMSAPSGTPVFVSMKKADGSEFGLVCTTSGTLDYSGFNGSTTTTKQRTLPSGIGYVDIAYNSGSALYLAHGTALASGSTAGGGCGTSPSGNINGFYIGGGSSSGWTGVVIESVMFFDGYKGIGDFNGTVLPVSSAELFAEVSSTPTALPSLSWKNPDGTAATYDASKWLALTGTGTATFDGQWTGKISLEQNANFQPTSFASTATLWGAGTIVLGGDTTSSTMPTVPTTVTTDAVWWYGTALLKNLANGSSLSVNLSSYANKYSFVATSGVTGYFSIYDGNSWSASDFVAYKLVDNGTTKAITINNGAGKKCCTIHKLIGTGTFVDGGTSAGGHTINFTDASEFRGSINLPIQGGKAVRLGGTGDSTVGSPKVVVMGPTTLASGATWTAYSGIEVASGGTVTVDGGTFGSAVTVNEGGTVVLGEHRLESVITGGGTVTALLTAAEVTAGEDVRLFKVQNGTLPSTVTVKDAAENEYPAAVSGDYCVAKIVTIVPPITTTMTAATHDFSTMSFYDSDTPPQSVTFAQITGFEVDVTAPAMDSTLTFDQNVTISPLKIINPNAYTLTLAKGDSVAATIGAYDFSGAVGKTTVNYATGAAAITAGSDTVLTQAGSGTITIANGKKATAPSSWTGTKTLSSGGTLVLKGGGTRNYDADMVAGATLELAGDTAYTFNDNKRLTVKGTLRISAPADTSTGGEIGMTDGTRLDVVNGGTFTIKGRFGTGYGSNNQTMTINVKGGELASSGNGYIYAATSYSGNTFNLNVQGGTASAVLGPYKDGVKNNRVNINVSSGTLAPTVIGTSDGSTVTAGAENVGTIGSGKGFLVTMTGGRFNVPSIVPTWFPVSVTDNATIGVQSGVTTPTFKAPIDIASAKTATIEVPEGTTLTASGAITGTGGTLAVSGTGTLSLPAGNASSNISLGDGTTLNVTGTSGQAAYLITSGTFAKGAGTLLLNGSDYATQGYQLRDNLIIKPKTATVDGSKTWDQLWGANPPAATDAVVLTVTANATLTFDSPVTIADFIVEGSYKLTLANGGNLTVTEGCDFRSATGTVDLGLNGIEDLAKNAVVGAPYSYWLFDGVQVLGAENITLPTMPNWYSVAKETVSGFGTRFVVTAPAQAQFGAVSVNMKNGHDLSDGDHGAYPVAKASWGEITSGTSPRSTTVDGVTFTLTGKTGTFYQNGTSGSLLYDYVDDANDNNNLMTITDISYAQYRIIVYFNSDGGNFASAEINDVSYSALATDGTASYTVKDSSATWGKNGGTANAPVEGVNYIVSDVLSGSSATVKIVSGRSSNRRGTPAAYQIVEVGNYYAGVDTHFVTPNAPANAFEGTTVTENNTFFGTDAKYAQTVGGRAAQVVEVVGASANDYLIFGGLGEVTGGTLAKDIWMEVYGGTYSAIFGGSDASRWQDSSAHNITGNIVLEVGGDTIVNHVYGGNYKEGYGTTVDGNVSVVVKDNAVVKGTIVGAGVSTHSQTGAYKKNTSVLVKNVQSDNTAGSLVGGDSSDYIIGGGVYGTNTKSKDNVTGNSSVTIDLASAATGNFVKHIVGGGFACGNYDDGGAAVGGNSSVTINAPTAVMFTGNIYAGGWATSKGSSTVAGTATVTLAGGTYQGAIKGGNATGDKTLSVTDDIVIKANNQTLSGFDAFTIADGKTVSLDAATDGGLVFALPGNNTLNKTGAGKLTLSGLVDGQAHTFIANAGTLTATGDTFGNSFGAGANGTVAFEWDVSAGGTIAHYPTIATSTGTVRFRLTLSKEQIKGQTEFTIATLPAGMTADDVTIALLNADTGNEVPYAAQMDGQLLKVRANVVVKTHEFTPTASGDITWQAGQPLVSGGENFSDYDNAVFRTTEFTTDVTVGGTKIEAGKVLVGGTYNFTGATPLIADALCTEAGADATFANDVVATDVAITNGTVRFASLTANGVVVSNATLDAKVLGPSMKYVRLTITATSGNQQPAVGEFRLYRGSATTGYTIVDWPQGTKISDSTPDTATKTSSDYPSEVGTKNEKQPGTLIDGYYGPDKTDTSLYADWQDPYATHDRNHNKWWPTSQSTGPWVVTIEFPYPVATFSGCNFCLADHEPRNPTAWTIEVSNDGQAWTEVANKSGATWSGQHAWCVGADKPEATLAENWPAFLNTGTTPTVVNVKNDATVVADGNWTAALNVSGKITFLGVEGKNLTLDAASTSSFAAGAKLKFDLNDYDVSAAGKQYVVAGPTEGWPEVKDITVEPSTFSLYKDAKGYYVVVESGNYWMGEDDTGVGTWNFRDTRAWGTNVTSEARFQWLNGVPAFFTHDGTVTIADDQVQPTAINVTSNNGIAVTFTGDLSMFATLPINVGSTNVTITLDNNEALTPSVSVVDGAVPNFVKTGTGGMTIASGNDFKQGTLTVRNGTLTVGNAPAINTFATVTAEGTGVIDINGKGADAGRTYTLGAGGLLVNNGGEIGVGSMQMAALVVNGNATVGGTGNFGLIASQWGETALTLGENTLVKTGANTFWLCHTTVTGNGMIDLQQGKIDTNSGKTMIPGTLKIGEGTEFLAKGKVSVGAIVGAGGTLNTTGTIDDFGLSGTLSLAGNGTYGTITMDEGAVANVGNRRDLTFAGAGTVDVKLTTQEEQTTTEITAFNRAGDGTTAVGKVYDSTGADVTSHVTKNGNKFTINHEAKAGTIFYFTLKQAIGEAAEGAVITMLANASVGDTAVTLNNSATLVGENYAITGAGITAASGKVLTIASGFIYLTDLGGTYALVGGKYPETSKAKWSAAQGYHYAQVDMDQATLYQIVKTGDTEPKADEKAYIVTGGTIAASKSDLVSKGYITQEQDVETFLNDNGANSIPNWQNVALGLSSTDATAKPFPAPVQGTSTTQVSLKLGNNVVVDKGSGATVTYKVMTGDGSSWTALPTEYAYGATATVDLPDDGVKYYKLDVIVTPAM